MSLKKPWKPLDRRTVASAPDRYGVYELGTDNGESIGVSTGVLADDLREAFAYGDARKVRWIVANSKEHAERLLEEHRG